MSMAATKKQPLLMRLTCWEHSRSTIAAALGGSAATGNKFKNAPSLAMQNTACFGTSKAQRWSRHIITTIFPRMYARMYYAQGCARVMSFSEAALHTPAAAQSFTICDAQPLSEVATFVF